MEDGTFKLSFKEKTRESLTLSVYNCGAQRCAGGEGWGEGVRDHYLIHFVRAGRGYLRQGEAVYPLGPGDLFIVYPGVPVKYWADAADPWTYDWVGFSGGEAGYLLRRTDFSRQRPVLHWEDGRLQPAIAAIAQAHGTRLSDQTRMIGRLYAFLALLLELSHPPAGQGEGYDYVGSATRYIAYNYSAGVDVSSIAQAIGVSRSHLYRMFMKSMGVSPNEYLTRYRVSQACALLRARRLSVGAVASSVGFEDPLYFSRVFKRVMGVSPRAWAAGQGGKVPGEAEGPDGP